MKSIKEINEQIRDDATIIIDTPEIVDLFNNTGIAFEGMIADDEQLMIYLPASTTGRTIDSLDINAHQYAQTVIKSLIEKFQKSPKRVGLIGDVETLSYVMGSIIQDYIYLNIQN